MPAPEPLGSDRIDQEMADLPRWRREDGALRRTYRAGDFPTAVRVVDGVVADAQELDHHPDIDLRYDQVHFALSTHSVGGVTALDVELAHRIERSAAPLVGDGN